MYCKAKKCANASFFGFCFKVMLCKVEKSHSSLVFYFWIMYGIKKWSYCYPVLNEFLIGVCVWLPGSNATRSTKINRTFGHVKCPLLYINFFFLELLYKSNIARVIIRLYWISAHGLVPTAVPVFSISALLLMRYCLNTSLFCTYFGHK